MALLAGVSLVAMAVTAGFGYGYAFESLYVPNDGATTLNNFRASPWLLRAVMASFTGIVILDIVVAWALHGLFGLVDKARSLIAAWFRLVYSAILAGSLMFLLPVLLDGDLQNPGLAALCFKCFLGAWSLGLVVFGVHLVLLGTVVIKSGFVPKLIGRLVLFAGLCYSLTNFADLVLPAYGPYKNVVEMVLVLPMALGELVLAVWLMIVPRLN